MLLKIDNVSKHFSVKSGTFQMGKRVGRAADRGALIMEKGEDFSLVGESECGKCAVARVGARLV